MYVPRFGLICLLLSSFVGCSNEKEMLPTFPVSGKVTLNGKPVANAEIWLVPTTPEVLNASMTVRPYAKSDKDGVFTLTSYITNDGAPAGDYGVMVQKVAAYVPSENEEGDEEAGKAKTFEATLAAMKNPSFPAKYRTPATSGLTFTVKNGPNQLDLDLKSK